MEEDRLAAEGQYHYGKCNRIYRTEEFVVTVERYRISGYFHGWRVTSFPMGHFQWMTFLRFERWVDRPD